MLAAQGYESVPGLLSPERCQHLCAHLADPARAGTRGLLADPEVAQLALGETVLPLMQRHLGMAARPVRAIYFDKTAANNWSVPWHQDLTIAVQERHPVDGFGPWSTKEEIPHVQPPTRLLEQMLTLRLHLDACDETNGALQVIPKSHMAGRLHGDALRGWQAVTTPELCRAALGDGLLMRPLLLHASAKSTSDRRRRILHLEYAGFELPPPLRWHEQA